MEKLFLVMEKMDATSVFRVFRKFREFDSDGSGTLEFSEFKKGFESANLSDDEMAEVFKELDKDKSGNVSKKEFVEIMTSSMTSARKDMLAEVFKSADKTGDGVISSDDLANTFAANSPDVQSGSVTVEQKKLDFLNAFEEDGAGKDGKVTYEEFEKYYTALSPRYSSDEQFITMVKRSWGLL